MPVHTGIVSWQTVLGQGDGVEYDIVSMSCLCSCRCMRPETASYWEKASSTYSKIREIWCGWQFSGQMDSRHESRIRRARSSQWRRADLYSTIFVIFFVTTSRNCLSPTLGILLNRLSLVEVPHQLSCSSGSSLSPIHLSPHCNNTCSVPVVLPLVRWHR